MVGGGGGVLRGLREIDLEGWIGIALPAVSQGGYVTAGLGFTC